MDISWDDARLFLAVMETGSFSAAARKTGVGQPTVSRRIALLEEQVGGPLFLRGAEGAVGTGLAQQLLPAAQQMDRWAAEWQRVAAGQGDRLAGRVRLAAPPGIARDFLVPFTNRVRACHPEIRIEVLATIEYLDLSRGQADLALRSRAPTAPDLTVLSEISVRLAVYGSPAYAARLPVPARASDLGWICWAGSYERLSPRPELEALIPNFSPAFASDNYLVQQRAAMEGLGAMILPRGFSPGPAGALVEIPTDLALPVEKGFLVCAKSALHIARVRAVADMLIEELAAIEG